MTSDISGSGEAGPDEDRPSILAAVAPERHRISSDDEPRREPNPEPGDVTDSESEYAVDDDSRPDLADGLDASDDDDQLPAEELYEAAPVANRNDDTSEEIAGMDSAT